MADRDAEIVMRSLARIRRRKGRCYELSMRVMLREAGAEYFTLVHGRYNSAPHAWIELPGGRIYDTALTDDFAAEHRDQYHADRRYTGSEAIRLAAKTGHSGPWDEREA